jgi:hypothetical protein
MRRVIAAVIVASVLGAGSAFAGSLELRMGKFFPKADSTRFIDDEDLFGTEKSDWAGFTGGLEYSWRSGRNFEIGVHLDGYGRSLDTSYRRYTRPSGAEITQTLELATAPLGVTARYVTGRRHSRLQAYVGVGVDVVFWEYKWTGSLIDFANDFDIVDSSEVKADGATPALHGVVGLRAGLTTDIFITAEGKYLAAASQDMSDDFEVFRQDVAPNRINLSGPSATLGIMVRF